MAFTHLINEYRNAQANSNNCSQLAIFIYKYLRPISNNCDVNIAAIF